jgi:hypothetical protein
MAIDVIHQIFPGTHVEWKRTARIPKPMMTIDETTSGEETHTLDQQDTSDDLYGPGADELRAPNFRNTRKKKKNRNLNGRKTNESEKDSYISSKNAKAIRKLFRQFLQLLVRAG